MLGEENGSLKDDTQIPGSNNQVGAEILNRIAQILNICRVISEVWAYTHIPINVELCLPCVLGGIIIYKCHCGCKMTRWCSSSIPHGTGEY